MASLKHLIASGTARILGPIYAENFIVPNGSSSQILLANGTTTPKSTFQSALPSYTGNGGKVLAVNSAATNVEWVTQTGGGGGGASSLNDLSDVTVSNQYSSQILKYNGTDWQNLPFNIPSGTCSDSSSTNKTVTIDGITALTDGLIIKVQNSSVASASGVTLNLNGLGALPIYFNTNGSWTRIAAHWEANYTFLLMYDTAGDGGVTTAPRWIMVDRDYNTNTNNATLQSVQSTSSWKKVLLSYNTVSTATGSITTGSTYGVHYVNSIAAQCSTGSLAANAFVTNGGTSGQFVKGDGTLGTYVTIYSGSSAPNNNTGNDGDIYIKTTA